MHVNAESRKSIYDIAIKGHQIKNDGRFIFVNIIFELLKIKAYFHDKTFFGSEKKKIREILDTF